MIERTQRNRRRAAGSALLAALLALAGAGCGGGEAKPGAVAGGTEEGAPGGESAPSGEAPGTSGAKESPETTAAERAEAGERDTPDGSANAGGSAPAGGSVATAEANRREVVLFFQRAEDDVLGPERRKILLTDSITDQAKQIVTELIAGPREVEGLLPTIPNRTKVLGFYLDRSGTAYLDLSEEFVTLHAGGSAEEVSTIFSIVDSLTYNLPEIKRVRFLVAGEERDTLKSHLDLRRAYVKDMSIVRLQGGV